MVGTILEHERKGAIFQKEVNIKSKKDKMREKQCKSREKPKK